MKVLITGGNGFIAKNLYEQLNDTFEITSTNSQELNLLDSSKVLNYLKNKQFDIIIHAATYDAAPKHSTKDPAKVLENNLKMFFNIARCSDYFKKMIYFGSGAEFGREHWIPKMKEEYFNQYVPEDQYGFSKYIMTKYTLLSNKIYNLRLFAVFGKYEDWNVRIISNLIYNTMFNLPLKINQNKYYDFTDISDVVKIVKYFIENNPKNKVYNICSGNVIDFKTIAEKIINISNKKIDLNIEIKGLGKEYSGDNSLLLKEIEDFKFSTFEESLKKLYSWYLSRDSEELNKYTLIK